MLHFSRLKTLAVMLPILIGLLFALPNVLPAEIRHQLPSWMPSHAMVLGLDLQGGSHMLLEVDTAAVRRARIEGLRDDVRRVLRDEKVGYTGLGLTERGVQLRLRDNADNDKALRKLRELATPLGGVLGGGGLDLDVSSDGNGLIQLNLTEGGINHRVRSAVDQSIEVVRRRIDQLGTTEPSIQRQGADRILVQVPGLDDPQRLKNLLGQTAQLSFRLVDTSVSVSEALAGKVPPESVLLNSTDDPPVPYVIQRRVIISGEELIDAQPGFDSRTQEPVVNFRFNANGARRFGAVTQENVGRPFAIVLDDEVISAPVIREPILGGSGQISGNFNVQQANDLAILLRAGALPAPLKIVEERTVGPGLGQDSIQAGEVAAWIGSASVVVFMIAIYGLFGIFAVLAVGVNIALIFGVLSVLGATLTLPGIAGIVLTVGMAVDSNVIVFERIRDEARTGRSAITAIDAGFSRALGTILDANVTTLLTSLVLFALGGSGPVRGFAVTLAVGIITTIFTAYTFTRLIIAVWVRSRRPSAVPI